MNYFTSLVDLDYLEPIKGLKAKVIHTDTQSFAFWQIEKNTNLPEHHHPHEQISIVTKGELELTIGNLTRRVSKGMFVYIPPNTPHSARAISAVELTDVFTPVREDLKLINDEKTTMG